jgi:hypothetical protein
MEPHDYPIEHFKMMAEVAVRLKSVPAIILRSDYNYESFGSWWFTFRRSGNTFRITFDGRDRYLNLERAHGDQKLVDGDAWQVVAGKQINGSSTDIISEINALVTYA